MINISSFFRLVMQVLILLVVAPVASVAMAGDSLDISQHRGQVVVVDFWASWCVPCRRSFPWMNEMQAKYGDDGLVIIGVNVDAEKSEAKSFLRDYPADFTVIYDSDGDLARQHDVIAMPSSYIFDRNGKQVARHLGFKVRMQNEYEALLVETLSQ